MGRVTLSAEALECIQAETIPCVSDDYCACKSGPCTGLLRAEAALIIRRAHLTHCQALAFMWCQVQGLAEDEAARLMGCGVEEVRRLIAAAFTRIRRVPHIGLLTVIVETFGWSAADAFYTRKPAVTPSLVCKLVLASSLV